MKPGHIPDVCLVLLASLALVSPASAQDGAGQPGTDAARSSTESSAVTIEAPIIQTSGTQTRASGGVLIQSGKSRLTGSDATYDVAASRGVLRHAMFTTCRYRLPHYRIEAREVTVLPGGGLRAKGVSLYMGRFKVLTLPTMRLKTAGRGASPDVFPRPSVDKNEGFSIAQKLLLADSDRLHATADLKVTFRHGIEGEVENSLGLGGSLAAFPGRFLSYESLRTAALTMPTDYTPPASSFPRGAARLREFTRISLNQRTYNVNNTGLVVFRQPEIGLGYIGPGLSLTGRKLDPRLEIYPEVTTSWGRFKESPGQVGFNTRDMVGVVAGLNILPLGPRTAVQPVIQDSYSSYGTGTSYRVSAWAVDASHLLPDGSFVSLRYIKRRDAGVTPFQFDRVQTFREIQGALQTRFGAQTLGLIAGYDLDGKQLYDWGVLYGHRTDCLAGSVSWSNLEKRFSFDIRLLTQ